MLYSIVSDRDIQMTRHVISYDAREIREGAYSKQTKRRRKSNNDSSKKIIHGKEMSKFSKLVSCRPDFLKKYFTLAPLKLFIGVIIKYLHHRCIKVLVKYSRDT